MVGGGVSLKRSFATPITLASTRPGATSDNDTYLMEVHILFVVSVVLRSTHAHSAPYRQASATGTLLSAGSCVDKRDYMCCRAV